MNTLGAIELYVKELNKTFYIPVLRYSNIFRINMLLKRYMREIKYDWDERHRRRIALMVQRALELNLAYTMTATEHAYILSVVAKLFKKNCSHQDVIDAQNLLQLGEIDWVVGNRQAKHIHSFTNK